LAKKQLAKTQPVDLLRNRSSDRFELAEENVWLNLIYVHKYFHIFCYFISHNITQKAQKSWLSQHQPQQH